LPSAEYATAVTVPKFSPFDRGQVGSVKQDTGAFGLPKAFDIDFGPVKRQEAGPPVRWPPGANQNGLQIVMRPALQPVGQEPFLAHPPKTLVQPVGARSIGHDHAHPPAALKRPARDRG
jgi:hypothetical protein